MNIGPYHVSRRNDNKWTIQWFDHASSSHEEVIIDDLESVIREVVENSQTDLNDCVSLLMMLIDDEDAFMQSPDAVLLNYIGDDKLITPDEYETWTMAAKFSRLVENFVEGFNSLMSASLKAPRVEAEVSYLSGVAEKNGLL